MNSMFYIIDWLIPDMNGIEIVRQIRKVIWKKLPHHHPTRTSLLVGTRTRRTECLFNLPDFRRSVKP